jgi:hypothetical protein
MTVDYRHGISILQLAAFLPTIFLGAWIAFRHGFGRNSGWIFFVIFSLIRSIGACCSLVTLSNNSVNVYVAWIVCNSVGLSPLLLGCLGLLSRANDSAKRKSMNNVNPYLFRLVGLLTIVALILTIVGQTSNTSSLQNLTQVDDKTKIGIVLFLVSWVGLCFLFFLVSLRLRSIEQGERRLLMAVGISIPLLLVRLVYSFLVVFANNPDFSTVTGNVTAMLVMSVIEEILVVYICLVVGLTLSVRPKVDTEAVATGYASDYTPVAQRPGIDNSQQGYTAPPPPKEPRRQRRQRRGGPIHQLVGMAVDEIAAARQR